MTSCCLKEKRKTENVSGSEKEVTYKNGALAIKSLCASCGANKSVTVGKKRVEKERPLASTTHRDTRG